MVNKNNKYLKKSTKSQILFELHIVNDLNYGI